MNEYRNFVNYCDQNLIDLKLRKFATKDIYYNIKNLN